MRKLLLPLLAACGLAVSAMAQQNPVTTYQINTTYYVKQVAGFLPTIQSAVTKACAATTDSTVNIPAGSTPADSIGAVTGGCTNVVIEDDRLPLPRACYAWSGSAYAAANCYPGGSGSGLPTATAPGQIIASTAAGTTYAVQGQIFYSQAGDTISSIEAECSSLCTYVVTVPQTITLGADHGLSANVQPQFAAGGKWTVNGAFTLTIPGNVTGTLNQHFAGSSTVKFGTLQAEVPIEWFGGIGDGVLSTGAGTDNAAAFGKCLGSLTAGQCLIQAAIYIVHSAVSVTTNGVGIRGAQQGYGYSGAAIISPSVIASNSATADILDIGGTDASHPVFWNVFQNFSVQRTVLPTGTAKGFSENYTCGVKVEYVYSEDSISDFYLHNAPSCSSGGLSHTEADWGMSVVPISSYTTGSYIGYDLDSEDGIAENSLFITYSGYAAPSNMPGGTAYATKIHGSAINDVNFFNFNGAHVHYGVYITYDGTGTAGSGGDIHFVQLTSDTSDNVAIYIENDPLAAGLDGINFDGGLISANNTLGGPDLPTVDIENCSIPIVFDTAQIAGPREGVYIHNSSNVSLVGNVLPWGSAYQISIDGGTNNLIVGNQLSSSLAETTGDMIKLSNTSVNNQISGNSLGGYAVNGMTLDATSQTNNIGPNTVDTTHITTAYSGFTSQNTEFPNTITCAGGSCGSGSGYARVTSEISGTAGANVAGLNILGNAFALLPTNILSIVGQQSALTLNTTFNGSDFLYQNTGGAAAIRLRSSASDPGQYQLSLGPVGTAGATFPTMDTTAVTQWCNEGQCWINPQATVPTFPANAALVVNPSANFWVDTSGAVTATVGTMPLYNASGTAQTSPHMVTGSGTLSTGSLTVTLSGAAVFSSSSSYVCSANTSDTGLAGFSMTYTSGSSVTFLSDGTSNAFRYTCVGN